MSTPTYLATVSDDVVMEPKIFIELMKKFRHHRSVRYGISRKHTKDILDYRKKSGLTGDNSTVNYSVPVTWDTDVTYVA